MVQMVLVVVERPLLRVLMMRRLHLLEASSQPEDRHSAQDLAGQLGRLVVRAHETRAGASTLALELAHLVLFPRVCGGVLPPTGTRLGHRCVVGGLAYAEALCNIQGMTTLVPGLHQGICTRHGCGCVRVGAC